MNITTRLKNNLKLIFQCNRYFYFEINLMCVCFLQLRQHYEYDKILLFEYRFSVLHLKSIMYVRIFT